MTTILDVCKLANVSKATVSRVLSGNRKVKDDTRDVVMRAVEQLNYRPNQLAQSLATKVSNTIGVLTNGLTDMQLGQILRQLDAALWGQGRSFVLANSVDNGKTLEQKLDFLAARHCDAIVIVGKNFDSGWFDELDVGQLPPLLTLNVALEDIDGVQFDQTLTSEMACNYLYTHGHSQIALLPESGIGGKQVIQGYRQALENRCIPYNKQLVVEHPDCATAISMLINRCVPFTAVVVPDDHQAIEVIRTLSQYNIQVPHDVSVISLNTSIEGERYTPAITGFELPEDRMLQSLLRLLEVNIKKEHAFASDINRDFVGKLTIRESVRTME